MATSRRDWLSLSLVVHSRLFSFIPTNVQIGGLSLVSFHHRQRSGAWCSYRERIVSSESYSLTHYLFHFWKSSIISNHHLSIRWSPFCGSCPCRWCWQRWLDSFFWRMQISLIFSTGHVTTSGVDGREVNFILNTFSLPIKIDIIFTQKKMKIDIIRLNNITLKLTTTTILSILEFRHLVRPCFQYKFHQYVEFCNLITVLDKFEEFWSNENYAQLMSRPTPFPPNHFST